MSKVRGKLIAQGAILHWWHNDEIGTTEAVLASASIWGDEYGYIALSAITRHPAALPIGAAYVASEIIQDPERAAQWVTDDYQPFVQEYIAPDIPTRPSEAIVVGYNEYQRYSNPRTIARGIKTTRKFLKYRGGNLSF
jgi:hypothetical protein